MRLFFAAWPPSETALALRDWARAIEGRATEADKMHLTLAFLGEADPEAALRAARNVHGAAHELPIEIAQFWKHNSIVWAGPRETPPELAALVERLRLELFKAHIVLEPRPFAAHITLVRKARRPRAWPPLPRVAWPVREFLLVKSTVSNHGSTYETLERFPLGKP